MATEVSVRVVGKPASVLLAVLLMVATGSGCQATVDADALQRRQLNLDLRRSCIEARGGARMDSLDLHAGNLSRRCTEWAYRTTRRLTGTR